MPDTDEALIFTPAELAFLATSADDERGRKSAAYLLLDEAVPESALVSGLGALRIRGWVESSEGRLAPVEPVGAIALALSSARRWVRVAFLREDEATALLVVWAEGLGVTVQPIEPGIVVVGAFSTPEQGGVLVREVIGRTLATNADSVVSIIDDRVDSSRSLLVRPTSSGEWESVDTDLADHGRSVDAVALVDAIYAWLLRG
jgi:hypothetical protein